MRRARMLVPEGVEGVYHVVSRVVERRMALGEEEKRHFVKLMKMYGGFSGIQVVSWCVMSNHFHMLVAVPEQGELSEMTVLKRMAMIYTPAQMAEIQLRLDAHPTAEGRRGVLAPYILRMGNLGAFMKSLKQRFTQWFNRKWERKGTLWEDRYHSTIVEYQGYSRAVVAGNREAAEVKSHAARIVAAYIDLNPIRAGMVEDPLEYTWSSYGAAVRGDKEAVSGLRALWGGIKAEALAAHRLFIFEEGSEEKTEDFETEDRRRENTGKRRGGFQDPKTGEAKARVGIDAKKVWAERQRGGRLPLAVMLRLRVRYLTDGAVIGSKEFVEKITGSGGEAKSGKPMCFGEWGGLHALRNLRRTVVGP